VRGLVAIAGAFALSFSVVALVVGPVVSVPVAIVGWLLCLAGVGGGLYWALGGVGRLRGARTANLLHDVDDKRGPGLASAARSAVELSTDPRALARSPELVAAHASRVGAQLGAIPVSRVVPWSWLRHPAPLIGAVALLLGTLLLTQAERSAAGAFALTHPGETDDSGVRVAAIVANVDVRLVYPGYLGEPPATLHDVVGIEAPRGTSVELTVQTRVPSTGGILEVAGTPVQLGVHADGSLVGRFVVREDGALTISVDDAEGERLKDPVPRTVRVLVDEAPRVALLDPMEDAIVELDEDVPMTWEATDDVGLRSVDLVVETPDGREVRRRLRQAEDVALEEARGGQLIVASAFGAGPGDNLRLWVEARDGDEVSGPNVGRSETRVLTVASEATRRAAAIADLSQVLDRALDALADRLEAPVPRRGTQVQARYERVSSSSDELVIALEDLATQLRAQPASTADASLYGEMGRRLRRIVTREARAHGRRPAPYRRRRAIDARAVEELESDAILLADTLARARIEDAAAITRELESLRREMVSLVAELRRADSPEARARLMAAINRAQQRMRELAERLAAMSEDVPSDFVNAEALGEAEAEDALQNLAEAVEAGDLDAAEEQLAELERRIDEIAALLGSGMVSFDQTRFGPRERAMAEAMDALAGLEQEQRRLAGQSAAVQRGAAERALRQSGGDDAAETARLARGARAIRRSLDEISGDVRGLADEESLERARQRVRDVEDALSTGDLGEARRMAEAAADDLDGVSRDLDLSALMFPGRNGRTSDAASSAQEAVDQLRDLRQDLDRAIPDIEDFVDERGRRQMRGDRGTQGRVMEAAESLAERFDEGPDGAPLSPDAARGVREARRSMERGHEALEREDPIEASRAQDEAARRLSELREELEKQREQQRGGGGGGEGGNESTAPEFREAVRIPGAEEFEGPMDLRRRLLDAMREGAPEGYGESVRRYYEELLR
jgi:hypothetical protein